MTCHISQQLKVTSNNYVPCKCRIRNVRSAIAMLNFHLDNM